MPELKGFSHIDLTVSDRELAAAWWQDVMGFTLARRWRGDSFDAITLMHPSGLVVSVMTHDEPGSGEFDERRIGLDHLAFQVADRDELQEWVAHLEANGVAHSGIADMSYGPTLVFRDPDNIQLELFVTPLAEQARRVIAEAHSGEASGL
ncbi:VOC family protein [Mycobacterium sp.]|uniref:VOC family protein n=1 Tax=Mycobacterium sp. TaxID=1785 RepID=UPI003C7665AD